MDRAAGVVHKLAKNEQDQYFPVRTQQAGSIKVLSFYFEFRDSMAHFYWRNARATETKTLFLLRHFRRNSGKSFGQATKRQNVSF